MPNPSQTRELRILRLVAKANVLLEEGVATFLLIGKLRLMAQRLWPTVKTSTRRAYALAALKMVLESPRDMSDLLTEAVSAQEVI